MIRDVVKDIKKISKLIDIHMDQKAQVMGLTAQQGRILDFIFANDGVFQKQIEERFFLSNATVTGIITRLEKKGFIVRAPMADRRFNRIIVTSKALKVREYLENVISENDNKMSQNVSLEEIEATYQTLEKILRNLEG